MRIIHISYTYNFYVQNTNINKYQQGVYYTGIMFSNNLHKSKLNKAVPLYIM